MKLVPLKLKRDGVLVARRERDWRSTAERPVVDGLCYREAMDAPLTGIRVIDWTIWQQGPVASMMLADLGAEVIKVEERDKGDPGRNLAAVGGGAATTRGTTNFYFESNNRHKKSLALDLKR